MHKNTIPFAEFFALILLGLACYVLPQINTPALAWRLGGYDLAEWVSIHPSVRADAGMTSALLLRLPLVCFTLLIAGLAGLQRGWSRVLLFAAALILAVAQLPPFEFFSFAGNDPNYRQQFYLALFSLAASIALLLPLPFRLRQGLYALAGLVGAGTLLAGLLQAQTYLQAFQLPVTISGFGWLGVGLFLALVVCTFWRTLQPQESNRAI
jgi:hypothetical protein